MLNSDENNITNYAQYRRNGDSRYTNYMPHNEYIKNNLNYNNFVYSFGKDLRNSKGYYFLTEQNNGYFDSLNNDSLASTSIKYCNNYEYPAKTKNTLDTINLNYSIISDSQNDEKNGFYSLCSPKNANLKNGSKLFKKSMKKMNSNQSNNNTQYYNSTNSTSYDIKNYGDNNNKQTIVNNQNKYIKQVIHNRTKSGVLNNKNFCNFQHKKKR